MVVKLSEADNFASFKMTSTIALRLACQFLACCGGFVGGRGIRLNHIGDLTNALVDLSNSDRLLVEGYQDGAP